VGGRQKEAIKRTGWQKRTQQRKKKAIAQKLQRKLRQNNRHKKEQHLTNTGTSIEQKHNATQW
jgi:hypothetical protein